MLRGLELQCRALDRANRAGLEWHSTGHLDVTSILGPGPGWVLLAAMEPWRGRQQRNVAPSGPILQWCPGMPAGPCAFASLFPNR